MNEYRFAGRLMGTEEEAVVTAIAPLFEGKVRRKHELNFVSDAVDLAVYRDDEDFLLSASADCPLPSVRAFLASLAHALVAAGIEFEIDLSGDECDERFSNERPDGDSE